MGVTALEAWGGGGHDHPRNAGEHRAGVKTSPGEAETAARAKSQTPRRELCCPTRFAQVLENLNEQRKGINQRLTTWPFHDLGEGLMSLGLVKQRW